MKIDAAASILWAILGVLWALKSLTHNEPGQPPSNYFLAFVVSMILSGVYQIRYDIAKGRKP